MVQLLMTRWNFPASIILPCRFHHAPESAPVKYRHQALIINLADYLTQKAQLGHSGNPVPVTIKNAPLGSPVKHPDGLDPKLRK